MTLPVQRADATSVAHAPVARQSIPCDRPGEHFVIEMKAHDNWLCRSQIRGFGQCNTEVVLLDTGLPPAQCPRCRQPFPWHGTMEVN